MIAAGGGGWEGWSKGKGGASESQGHVYWEASLAFGPRMWHGYTGI